MCYPHDLFDRSGGLVAHCSADGDVCLISGEVIARFEGDALYGVNGRFLGYLSDGVVRDENGNLALRDEEAKSVGGYAKQIGYASASYVKSVSYVQQVRQARSTHTTSWCDLSGEEFLRQE